MFYGCTILFGGKWSWRKTEIYFRRKMKMAIEENGIVFSGGNKNKYIFYLEENQRAEKRIHPI